MESHYTLFYCYMHDCGCVIKGEHEYTPLGYNMAHAENYARNCDTSDWYNMGVITYDGNKVNIIKQIRINYDRYGGGYEFNMYKDEFTDAEGNRIIMEDESLLINWFEEVSNYSKSVGEVLYIKN
jgi:hypothetical protein